MSLIPRIILLGLYALSLNSICIAQTAKYIDHIGSEDGLVSQLCQQLIEDDQGNLWISSFGEIQKYNGYDVTIFPTDQSAHSKGTVLELKKDLLGNIWVIQGIPRAIVRPNHTKLVYDYQFIIIDPEEDKVIQFEEYIASDIISDNDIKAIRFIDRHILLLTHSNEIYSYKEELEYYCDLKDSNSFLTISETGEFIHYENNALNFYNQHCDLTSSIDSQTVASHDVFVTTKDGSLFFLNEENKKVKFIQYADGIYTDSTEIPTRNFILNSLTNTLIEKFDDGTLIINDKLFLRTKPIIKF